MRDRLREDERNEEHGYNLDADRLEYMNCTIAASKVFNINGLSEWTVPMSGNIYDNYVRFTTEVDHFTTQIRIRNAPKRRKESVGLDNNAKIKIHHYIDQIREIIDGSGIPEEKKESLYETLHNFALEVDKGRTALNAGMAVFIAICAGIGQGFEKLEPARRWIDLIATLLGKAKELEDSARPRLPSPTEQKRLQAPPKGLPKAEPREEPDDDIPF